MTELDDMVKLTGSDLLKAEHRLGRRFASYLKLHPSGSAQLGQRLGEIDAEDSRFKVLLVALRDANHNSAQKALIIAAKKKVSDVRAHFDLVIQMGGLKLRALT